MGIGPISANLEFTIEGASEAKVDPCFPYGIDCDLPHLCLQSFPYSQLKFIVDVGQLGHLVSEGETSSFQVFPQLYRGLLHDDCPGTLEQGVECCMLGTDAELAPIQTLQPAPILGGCLNIINEPLQRWKGFQELGANLLASSRLDCFVAVRLEDAAQLQVPCAIQEGVDEPLGISPRWESSCLLVCRVDVTFKDDLALGSPVIPGHVMGEAAQLQP